LELLNETGAAELENFIFRLGPGPGLLSEPEELADCFGFSPPPLIEDDETGGFFGAGFNFVLVTGFGFALDPTVFLTVFVSFFLPVFVPSFVPIFVPVFSTVFSELGVTDAFSFVEVFAAGLFAVVFGFLAGFFGLNCCPQAFLTFASSSAFFAANLMIRFDRLFGVVRGVF
jgi:hypothetical protein